MKYYGHFGSHLYSFLSISKNSFLGPSRSIDRAKQSHGASAATGQWPLGQLAARKLQWGTVLAVSSLIKARPALWAAADLTAMYPSTLSAGCISLAMLTRDTSLNNADAHTPTAHGPTWHVWLKLCLKWGLTFGNCNPRQNVAVLYILQVRSQSSVSVLSGLRPPWPGPPHPAQLNKK